jgi:ATP-dependent HslUV protease subunit HslV
MIAVDDTSMLLISGNGDVIEPDEGIVAIGSGAVAAQASATALFHQTELDVRRIVEVSMQIAASLCVFTNERVPLKSSDL